MKTLDQCLRLVSFIKPATEIKNKIINWCLNVTEPKRRIRNYFRRLFRKKSRGAADSKIKNSERDGDIGNRNREEVTLGHPAGRTDETRSRSAGELLTDSCDRQR